VGPHAYLLSAAIFTPIMGRLGDMHGKERLLVVTLWRSRSDRLGCGRELHHADDRGSLIQASVVGPSPVLRLIRDEFPKEKVMGAIASSRRSRGGRRTRHVWGPIVDALDYTAVLIR